MELGRPAHMAQATLALLDRLDPELVAVKAARPLEVLSGQLGEVWAWLSGAGMVVSSKSSQG